MTLQEYTAKEPERVEYQRQWERARASAVHVSNLALQIYLDKASSSVTHQAQLSQAAEAVKVAAVIWENSVKATAPPATEPPTRN
jgi:hypothetical protein